MGVDQWRMPVTFGNTANFPVAVGEELSGMADSVFAGSIR